MNKIVKCLGAGIIFLVIIAGIYYEYNFKTGNFHEITAGEAYRSAQLNPEQLKHYLMKYRIKSVLNLRGSEPHVQWYDDEIKVSAAYHVAHYDIALSAFPEY